ncbi:MAG: YwiC-like family protein [Cyanobacteria bacterium P01_D01_bin.156]
MISSPVVAPPTNISGNAKPINISENSKSIYLPTFSPEHGVLLVLMGALLTGASLAQTWTWETTLACVVAFLGLQAEHPLIVQLKRRRHWKPRYVLWASVYGGSALIIAAYLAYRHPVLLWVCGAAAIAMGIDMVAVLQRQQKAIATEILMFSAICMATLFVYGTNTDTITVQALGLWLLNSCFFASAVFTIKLRKARTSSLKGSFVFHSVAIALTTTLYLLGWLSLFTALTLSVVLIKLVVVILFRDWYCNCHFGHIARFETYFALTYTALACLTVLPEYLPVA